MCSHKPNAFFVHNEIGGVIERCDAIHYNTRKVAVIKIMKKGRGDRWVLEM